MSIKQEETEDEPMRSFINRVTHLIDCFQFQETSFHTLDFIDFEKVLTILNDFNLPPN